MGLRHGGYGRSGKRSTGPIELFGGRRGCRYGPSDPRTAGAMRHSTVTTTDLCTIPIPPVLNGCGAAMPSTTSSSWSVTMIGRECKPGAARFSCTLHARILPGSSRRKGASRFGAATFDCCCLGLGRKRGCTSNKYGRGCGTISCRCVNKTARDFSRGLLLVRCWPV